MTSSPSPASSLATRLPWVLVGVLSLLNAALVGWLWLVPPAVGRSASTESVDVSSAAFLADTLRFSSAQRVRYDTLRAHYQRQIQPLAQRCRSLSQQCFAQLDASQTDEQLETRSRAALASKVALDVATVRHLQQVAALCTPAQRAVLQQLLDQPTGEECTASGEAVEECLLPVAPRP